jgi:hypothetical protein
LLLPPRFGLELLPRRGDALKFACVGPGAVPTVDHVVAVGEFCLKRHMQVRESVSERLDELAKPFAVVRNAGRRVVDHEVGGDQLVEDARLVLVEAFFKQAADEGLIFLGGHD